MECEAQCPECHEMQTFDLYEGEFQCTSCGVTLEPDIDYIESGGELDQVFMLEVVDDW